MYAIFSKELGSFFSNITGYLVAIVFFVLTGLFMWVLPGPLNVLDGGYATLDSLFALAPWVFMFLVPAVTMRTFADETRSGTIELLLTRPISDLRIILGKYFASIVLIIILLIPVLIYYLTVYLLGSPVGNIDLGGTWGSFIGLFFLATVYAAVGIFASSLTSNQIVAFLLAVVICLLLFLGLKTMAQMPFFANIKHLLLAAGIDEHYSSMSRGVIDSRDLAYFLAVDAIFVVLTRTVLESRKW